MTATSQCVIINIMSTSTTVPRPITGTEDNQGNVINDVTDDAINHASTGHSMLDNDHADDQHAYECFPLDVHHFIDPMDVDAIIEKGAVIEDAVFHKPLIDSSEPAVAAENLFESLFASISTVAKLLIDESYFSNYDGIDDKCLMAANNMASLFTAWISEHGLPGGPARIVGEYADDLRDAISPLPDVIKGVTPNVVVKSSRGHHMRKIVAGCYCKTQFGIPTIIVMAPSSFRGTDNSFKNTLLHEYTHHAMMSSPLLDGACQAAYDAFDDGVDKGLTVLMLPYGDMSAHKGFPPVSGVYMSTNSKEFAASATAMMFYPNLMSNLASDDAATRRVRRWVLGFWGGIADGSISQL